MFLGQSSNAIDEKGRITIPARFRELLGDSAYVTLGLSQNLIVLPEQSFLEKADKANAPGMTNLDANFFRELFFANASHLEFDKAGRALIPQFLRDAAGLSNSAVVAGVGMNFEIWNPDRWAKQLARMQDPEYIAERLKRLDI